MRLLVLGIGLWAACGEPAVEQPEESGLACGDGVDNDDDGLTDCAEALCEAIPVCTCGNGALDIGELCDDGNDDDGDACLNRCVPARCGDGIVERAREECDDANANDTDACLATCVAATCGDGVTWAGQEACDDDNGVDTDACRNACVEAACGDGVVWVGFEGCDDANGNPNDACRNDCVLASCGDGMLQLNEACDDDNDSNTDGCLNSCLLPQCGDGFTWAGMESCDDGNFAVDDACIACEVAVCGDGYVRAGVEVCDDGNASAGDGCSELCGLELVNRGFEDGELLRGWTLERSTPGTGAWTVVTAGQAIGYPDYLFDPLDGMDVSTFCVPAGFQVEPFTPEPVEGGWVALVTQVDVGWQRLYQDFTIAPGQTTVTWWMSYGSYDVYAPTQTMRISLLDPATNEVLRPLFETVDPGVSGWTYHEGSLEGLEGSTVRLEFFIEVDTWCMPVLLDDVQVG